MRRTRTDTSGLPTGGAGAAGCCCGHLARPVAQLRRRPAPGRPAGHPAPRVRPRRHALRPGQQLRPAVRIRGDQFRPDPAGGSRPVPGRDHHLDEGRVRHVARPVRRVGIAQVPALQPRPVAEPDGRRPRRHLLQPPVRPGDAPGGDDGRAGPGRPVRKGAVRGHLVLLARAHRGGRGDPARHGHAAADPPAVLLDAQPLDRGRAARHARTGGRRLHRVLAAGAGMLSDRYLDGIPEGPGPARAPRSRPACSPRRTCGTSGR